MKTGHVKHWDSTRGFGFIESAGSPDCFAHVSDLVGCAVLGFGDIVTFEATQGPRGWRAFNVHKIEREQS
jgi:CspA family cold shock protein